MFTLRLLARTAKQKSVSVNDENKDNNSFFTFYYQVFNGNSDLVTAVTHYFDAQVSAQFVRILPLTFSGYPALRIELYGCEMY